MEAKLNSFIQDHNGNYLNYGDTVPNQCVSVANAWSAVLGFPIFTGNAITIINQAGVHYQKVANTPENVPVAGDIVVWGENSGAQTGPDGHVGVFVSGNATSFTSFDQNYPTGSKCHEQGHNYDGVLGWLHPLEPAPAPAPPPTVGTATVEREVNVRAEPNTASAITSVLQPGNTFKYTGKVVGETVSGNDFWYHSEVGHYVWSGDCTG